MKIRYSRQLFPIVLILLTIGYQGRADTPPAIALISQIRTTCAITAYDMNAETTIADYSGTKELRRSTLNVETWRNEKCFEQKGYFAGLAAPIEPGAKPTPARVSIMTLWDGHFWYERQDPVDRKGRPLPSMIHFATDASKFDTMQYAPDTGGFMRGYLDPKIGNIFAIPSELWRIISSGRPDIVELMAEDQNGNTEIDINANDNDAITTIKAR